MMSPARKLLEDVLSFGFVTLPVEDLFSIDRDSNRAHHAASRIAPRLPIRFASAVATAATSVKARAAATIHWFCRRRVQLPAQIDCYHRPNQTQRNREGAAEHHGRVRREGWSRLRYEPFYSCRAA